MATNRTAARAKGNCWPDSETYARLQNMVAQGALIAIRVGSGLLAWARIVANVILNNPDSVGIGTTTPRSLLDVVGAIATAHRLWITNALDLTSTYLVGDSWVEVTVGGVGDDANVNLPGCANCPGRVLLLTLLTTAGATLFLSPVGAETIDGAPSPVLTTANDFLLIQSDGVSNWKTLASKVAGVPA